jgi:hypothetical protein
MLILVVADSLLLLESTSNTSKTFLTVLMLAMSMLHWLPVLNPFVVIASVRWVSKTNQSKLHH